MNDRKTQRVGGIDVLRGLSIIAVVLMHVNQRASIAKTFLGKPLHPQILSAFFKSGYLGVIVFFVISGFLITSSSVKRWGNLQNTNVRKFYLIRFARIAPCLIALLTILSALHCFGIPGFVIDPERATLGRAVVSALTFHVNWLEAKHGYLPGVWDVLWSLSVEETFYLFFPLICVFLKNQRVFILFMCIFLVLGPVARTLGSNEIWQDHSYLSCMDGIALGCLTALFATQYRLSKRAYKWISRIGFVLFVSSFLFKKQIFLSGLSDLGLNVTILEIATALVILSVYNHPIKNKIWLPFRWLGQNSYEIYLTHMFIVTLFENTGLMDPKGSPTLLFSFVLILVLSGLAGHFVARWFSEPANLWIRARWGLFES